MKKGQVTVFVIVAIVIIAAIVLFFAFRDRLGVENVPAEFAPVYNLYSSCISQELESGVQLLGLQGGRINTENYEPGNDYSPFSSHLSFFGSPVEYWYSVTGNGFVKENSVTKEEMERQLEDFLAGRVNDCRFDEFYSQGFYVGLPENVEVNVDILDNEVRAEVISDVVSYKEDRSARKRNHEVEISSRLGSLYNQAREIYSKELQESFLEDYGIDVLRLYAPVDGVEISCSPEVWRTGEVVSEIKQGLQENLGKIKFRGDYYSLTDDGDDYFVIDERVEDPVRFLYFENWPSKVEIYGDNVDQALMVADPVGNQEGLGIMGFCYVPYHFVYDVAVPVMVQVGDGLEVFQFPVLMIIDNNLPKKANLTEIDYGNPEFDLCDFREGSAEIRTFDNSLNPVEANVAFECLDQRCNLGSTEVEGNDAVLLTDIPQCVNGKLVARAEGFADAELLFSSNSQDFADLILEREYEVNVNVLLDGRDAGNAIVYFLSDSGTRTAVLPDNPEVSLKEGRYTIEAYVYGDTGIFIPASKRTECIETTRSGILGLFGATKEECFTIDLPETKIENALRGGGRIETYILANELDSGNLELEVQSLPVPNSLEQLQQNYEIFNNLDIGVVFR